MPKLRHLSCEELVAALSRFGFGVTSQRGSHKKLARVGADGARQTLTVPNHAEIAPGTLRAILRQASRFVPVDELRPYFYHE